MVGPHASRTEVHTGTLRFHSETALAKDASTMMEVMETSEELEEAKTQAQARSRHCNQRLCSQIGEPSLEDLLRTGPVNQK